MSTFQGISAADNVRQHNGHILGNVTNNNTYNYPAGQQRVDERSAGDDRKRKFLKAAAEGQLRRVEYFIRIGVDLDHTDEENMTALHHAAYSGFEDVVEVLIQHGCDVNAYSDIMGTPLKIAEEMQRANVVAILQAATRSSGSQPSRSSGSQPPRSSRSQARLNPRSPPPVPPRPDSSDMTGYARNGYQGHDEFAQQSTAGWWTDANYSSSRSRLVSPPPLLPGPASRHVDEYGRAATRSAAQLPPLPPGLDTKKIDGQGRNALHRAVAEGNLEHVRLLLLHGLNPNSPDRDKFTSLHVAARNNRANVVPMLLDAGADVHALDLVGCTPLHSATEEGFAEGVRTLLLEGASVNAVCHNGETPLHLAALHGDAETIRMLLAAGASVNAENEDGQTPLYVLFGSWNDKATKIEMLLKAGASAGWSKTDKRQTALELAERAGLWPESVRLLRKAGAK